MSDAELTAKKVCFVHYDDLVKLEKNTDLISKLESKGSTGLIVLLLDKDRAHGGFKGSIVEQERFHAFAEALTTTKVPYPVYFTFETDELLVFYDLLSKSDDRLNDLAIEVRPSNTRPKTTDQIQLDVLYGVEATKNPEGKPIIAVSASYDSLGTAPSLPIGMEGQVSPVLALLYMSRVMSRQFVQV